MGSECDEDFLGGMPEGSNKVYNSNMEPCDMVHGPCVCGAWHHEDDFIWDDAGEKVLRLK